MPLRQAGGNDAASVSSLDHDDHHGVQFAPADSPGGPVGNLADAKLWGEFLLNWPGRAHGVVDFVSRTLFGDLPEWLVAAVDTCAHATHALEVAAANHAAHKHWLRVTTVAADPRANRLAGGMLAMKLAGMAKGQRAGRRLSRRSHSFSGGSAAAAAAVAASNATPAPKFTLNTASTLASNTGGRLEARSRGLCVSLGVCQCDVCQPHVWRVCCGKQVPHVGFGVCCL